MITFGAQVDRRGELLGVQVGQPVGALAEPADLVEQAVADQVPPVQLGVIIPAGIFRRGPARGPQLPQLGIQPVQVRGGRDLVHPRRRQPRRGRQGADRDPLRAGRGQRPAAFPLRLLQAPRRPDTRASTRRSRRQAAIRSLIVTLTPCPCQAVFSKLDGLTRFLAPLLPAPRSYREPVGAVRVAGVGDQDLAAVPAGG